MKPGIAGTTVLKGNKTLVLVLITSLVDRCTGPGPGPSPPYETHFMSHSCPSTCIANPRCARGTFYATDWSPSKRDAQMVRINIRAHCHPVVLRPRPPADARRRRRSFRRRPRPSLPPFRPSSSSSHIYGRGDVCVPNSSSSSTLL